MALRAILRSDNGRKVTSVLHRQADRSNNQVLVEFPQGQSIFHAHWLWCNDPSYIHATSGQFLRSPSSFYGWRLQSASTVSSDQVEDESVRLPVPSPPFGCLHPVGNTFDKLDANQEPLEPSDLLCVTWEHDREGTRQSYYDMNWLWKSRYDAPAMKEVRQQTAVTLDKCLRRNTPLVEVDYDDVVSGDACFDALHAVFEQGAALARNAPMVDDESVVARLGHTFAGGLSHSHLYGETFHVQTMADAHNIAYTSHALPPHQDLAYYESKPGLQLLHCVANTAILGGESTLIDAMAAAEEFRHLAPELFEILSSCEATFLKQRHNADMVYRSPHIDVDSWDNVVGIRWSPPFEGPLRIEPDLVDDFYLAYSAFERMLDNSLPREPFLDQLDPSLEATLRDYANEYTWEQRLEPGDVLVFNNQRLLHGRRGFEIMPGETGDRHLIGCYTNMEETLSRYRLLRRQQSPNAIQRNAGNGSSGVI